MKNLLKQLTVGLAALLLSATVLAGEKGTPEEAVALVKKAVAYLKVHGNEKAFAVFSDPKGEFVDRDLYIYAANMSGVALAHGANARLIGKSVLELRDADGKYFVKELLEIGNTKGKGWVDYKWPNPVTKAIEQKSTYLERVGDIAILCGVYK